MKNNKAALKLMTIFIIVIVALGMSAKSYATTKKHTTVSNKTISTKNTITNTTNTIKNNTENTVKNTTTAEDTDTEADDDEIPEDGEQGNSIGSNLINAARKANQETKDMTPAEKANYALSMLFSGKIIKDIVIVIIIFEIYKLFLRCVIYKKAKKHAWAVLVPIYREVVMLQICGMSPWWLLLLLIPVFGWIGLWIVSVASKFMLAEGFQKGVGFAFGLWLLWPIFESILVFSKKTKYVGIDK